MATTAGSGVFLDTNVLIFAHSTLAPVHTAALAALRDLETAGTEVWISRQVIREYLVGMSRPGTFTGMAPQGSLIADVTRFESRFRVAEDGPGVTAELLQLLATITSRGKQIHDANIVATMIAHGIPELLTDNVSDFARFAGVITVLPLIPLSPVNPSATSTPPPPPPGAP